MSDPPLNVHKDVSYSVIEFASALDEAYFTREARTIGDQDSRLHVTFVDLRGR